VHAENRYKRNILPLAGDGLSNLDARQEPCFANVTLSIAGVASVAF